MDSPTDTLFLGNLSPLVTRRILFDLCCQAGPLKRVSLVSSGPSAGNRPAYGFATYDSVESAAYAWALLRGCVRLYGREVTVAFSKQGGNPPGDMPAAQLWLDKGRSLHLAAAATPASAPSYQTDGRYMGGRDLHRESSLPQHASASSRWESGPAGGVACSSSWQPSPQLPEQRHLRPPGATVAAGDDETPPPPPPDDDDAAPSPPRSPRASDYYAPYHGGSDAAPGHVDSRSIPDYNDL